MAVQFWLYKFGCTNLAVPVIPRFIVQYLFMKHWRARAYPLSVVLQVILAMEEKRIAMDTDVITQGAEVTESARACSEYSR